MRFRLSAALALAALVTTLVPYAEAQQPSSSEPSLQPPPARPADLPPPGAKVTHLVAGAAMTATSYGLALGASYLFEDDMRGAKDLRIPVAGPWMALAQTGCPSSDPDCSVVPLVLGAIFQIVDGVTQAGGLAIIGEGLFLKTSSARPAPRKAQGPSVRAVPMDFGRGRLGMGFVGTF